MTNENGVISVIQKESTDQTPDVPFHQSPEPKHHLRFCSSFLGEEKQHAMGRQWFPFQQ